MGAFDAVSDLLRASPGFRLFTVLLIPAHGGWSWRCHSSHPDVYPLGCAKPIVPGNEFHQVVVASGKPRFVPDEKALRAAFADHAVIQSLGCGSAVNVPVRHEGRTIAALNLLHATGRYEPWRDTGRLMGASALAIAAVLRAFDGTDLPAPE